MIEFYFPFQLRFVAKVRFTYTHTLPPFSACSFFLFSSKDTQTSSGPGGDVHGLVDNQRTWVSWTLQCRMSRHRKTGRGPFGVRTFRCTDTFRYMTVDALCLLIIEATFSSFFFPRNTHDLFSPKQRGVAFLFPFYLSFPVRHLATPRFSFALVLLIFSSFRLPLALLIEEPKKGVAF